MSAMWIAKGSHQWGSGQLCTNEWIATLCPCEQCAALRRRHRLTDCPPCSPRTIAAVVPVVQDGLDDDHRQRMVARIPLIPSVATDADPDVVARVEVRIARWLADSAAEWTVAAWAESTRTALHAERAEEWAVRAEAEWESSARAEATEAAEAAAMVGRHAAATVRYALEEDPGALLDWLDSVLAMWAKIAADEGLIGSCSWLDLDLDADPDEYTAEGGS